MTFRDDRVAVHHRADDLARQLQEKELALAAAEKELAVAKDSLATAGITVHGRPGSLALHRLLDRAWVVVVLSLLVTGLASLQSERLGMQHAVHSAFLSLAYVGLRLTQQRSVGVRVGAGVCAGLGGTFLLFVFFAAVWPSL